MRQSLSRLARTLHQSLARFGRMTCLASPLVLASLQPAAAQGPDVLILGDSQLSFGAGKAFVELLSKMAGSCGLEAGSTTGVIGVRSSAPASWTARTKKGRASICNVDPKWRVNAGVYGTFSRGKNPYVQIGQDPAFPFCRPDTSPLQSVFADGNYSPRLVILFFLGNAADRWADSPDAAAADLRAVMRDLPKGQPCIVMTTAPPYGGKVVALRQKAQDNLARAFASGASHCSFVPGFTAATIAENKGNSANFRRKPSGRVKDPFHPTEAGARRFLSLRRAAICEAISKQMAMN
jgi:hypothetical protein